MPYSAGPLLVESAHAMQRFQLGHAAGGSADELLARCLATIGTIDPAANFGFVYATDVLVPDLTRVVAELQRKTGITQWTGTTGLGICATAQEYYDAPALAIMLASLPPAAFRGLPLQTSDLSGFLRTEAAWLAEDSAHFGVLHADPSNEHTAQLITDLGTKVPGAFCVGGLTSSRSTNLQISGAVTAGGLSGVLFSSAIPVVTSHTQGCTRIGQAHRITACEQNILIQLDHRPALEVFKEEVGDVIAQDLRRAGGYIFAGFPIAGSDTGDYLVRNLLGIDPEQKMLAIAEYLTVDTELVFCRRDGNSAREDLQRMLNDLKQRMGGAPRGALYYSCVGRGRHQFGENSNELRTIRDALGDLPLVGFFANGEIFHNRLYAYTGVLTIFC